MPTIPNPPEGSGIEPLNPTNGNSLNGADSPDTRSPSEANSREASSRASLLNRSQDANLQKSGQPSVASTDRLKPKAPRDWRLPNGMAQTSYSYHFSLPQSGLSGFRVISIANLEGTGLTFEEVDQRLTGIPTGEPGKAKDYILEAELAAQHEAGAETIVVRLLLLVNPDPRSLWKEIEPDAGLPHQKLNRDSDRASNEALHAVVASIRGRSHANNGTFREDDFCLRKQGQWIVIAVSDGAGSAKLSRLGSRIAVQTSAEYLINELPKLDRTLEAVFPEQGAELQKQTPQFTEVRKLLLNPVGKASFHASNRIKAKSEELSVPEKDLSATLILAAIRKWGSGYLIASYWIGDGAAAIYNHDTSELILLGNADSGEFSGQTRFLLSDEFSHDQPWNPIVKRFRCEWVPRGSALILMTDGVSDPKFGTDNALKDKACWATWWRDDLLPSLNLARDNTALPIELQSYLDFWSPGEHDDRTLAIVY